LDTNDIISRMNPLVMKTKRIRHAQKNKAPLAQIIGARREGFGDATEAKVRARVRAPFFRSETVLARNAEGVNNHEHRGENARRAEVKTSFLKGRSTHASR